MAFMTLALTQVFHAFNARSQKRSVLTFVAVYEGLALGGNNDLRGPAGRGGLCAAVAESTSYRPTNDFRMGGSHLVVRSTTHSVVVNWSS